MMTGAALAVLALAPALAAHAATASDNGQIAEVVVTATKMGETNLQKTPIPVEVVNAATLKEDNVENLKDLQSEVPSLVIQHGLNDTVTLRGVGGFNGLEGDISEYFDGVYLARQSVVQSTNFNDLDRIEVLEGPQGTLFGRNSTAGAINFVSKAPSNTFGFQNTLNVGDYSLIDESARITGPIADNMQASLSFSHTQHDGYVHNVDPGVGDVDAENRTGAKAQLRWEPTADITNTVRVDWLYTNEAWEASTVILTPSATDTLANSTLGNFHETDMSRRPNETEHAYGVNDELNWKLNDNLSLKSLSALRTDTSFYQNGSFGSIDSGPGGSVYSEYQVSQEFNLLNNYGPFSGLVGLFIYDDQSKQVANVYKPEGIVGNPPWGIYVFQNVLQPTLSNAVFFQEKYQITPTIDVIVGARYTEERKTLNSNTEFWTDCNGYTNAPFCTNYLTSGNTLNNPYVSAPAQNPFIADLNRNYHAFTPKVVVDWQATPDALVYASISEGTKSGGFSGTAQFDAGASFGQELLWDYELGAKTEWFDHTLRLNADVFHYRWSGLQFNAEIGPEQQVVSNAGDASLTGFELNAVYKPVPPLTMTAGLVLLNSDYNYFPNYIFNSAIKPYLPANTVYGSQYGQVTYNASGNQLVNAPNVTFNWTGQYDHDIGNGSIVYGRVEYQYQSKVFFDPTDAPISARPAMSLIGASIGYEPANSHWKVALWGKNLTDTQYITGITIGSPFTAPIGDPRTYGVRIEYTY
jgi:iron complex outermembrane receptor protein